MLSRLYLRVLFIGFCCVLTFSQGTDAQDLLNGLKEKKEQSKREAVSLLSDILAKSRSVGNVRERSVIISEASTLLWDFEQQSAESALVVFIEQTLDNFQDLSSREKRIPEENKKIDDLDFALRTSLKALARKNSKSGSEFQSLYFKIREKNFKTRNANDEMEMAVEGLELDEQRTLELLSAIIRNRIPSNFPELLIRLRKKNPHIADILLQRAIENISVSQSYNASDAIFLSTAVFNERVMLVPLLADHNNPNSVGVFTSYLGTSRSSFTDANISSFLVAVQRFFNARLANNTTNFFHSSQNLLQSYFLLEKLRSYGHLNRRTDLSDLDRVLVQLVAYMHTAGFSSQTISIVKGYAFRLVGSNNPLNLDDGTSAFEKAESAGTSEEKLDYLITGIIQSIEARLFERAERRIFDVQDSKIRDALYLFLHLRAGLQAIENKNWHEFEKITDKLSDKTIRAFLFVKAISGFEFGRTSPDLINNYIIKAEKNIEEISEKSNKASAMLVLASSLFSLDSAEAVRYQSATIHILNDAPDFNLESEFQVRVVIPTRQGFYGERVGNDSFRTLFSRLAGINWTDSQVQSLQIKRNDLRAIALIAAAKTVLKSDETKDLNKRGR